jgi:hypothetical protein
MLGNYSKLIGALVGNIVAIVLVYLATQGLATCAAGPDGTTACAILGFSQAQITAAVLSAVNMALVYAFPANRPPS